MRTYQTSPNVQSIPFNTEFVAAHFYNTSKPPAPISNLKLPSKWQSVRKCKIPLPSTHECIRIRTALTRCRTNLVIILGMMQVSKKIPMEDPDTMNLIRAGYLLSNAIIIAIYAYTHYVINKKKGNALALIHLSSYRDTNMDCRPYNFKIRRTSRVGIHRARQACYHHSAQLRR